MIKLFISDLEKYKRYSNSKSSLLLILTTQGLWALFVYRIFSSVYKSKLPNIIKRPFLFFGVFIQKNIEIITGITLPYSATIGKAFYIAHYGNIIIHPSAIIGDNCNISQGVTIGVSGFGELRGVPKIGDNVYIGANSVVVGKIEIKDNCIIGACSLVKESLKSNSKVLGVPARIIGTSKTNSYI